MTLVRGTLRALMAEDLKKRTRPPVVALGSSSIVGNSPAIRRLRALIAKVAPSSLPVLIQGPTGSGKELVARALHSLSRRRGPLVAFNMCAVADTMLEATLFGHARGAFTGARESVPGYLADADGGTVFLDEISELSLALQPKLLRAVETREFRPVGARTDRHSDFRVVSATNEGLHELIQRGRFRADLAHRLAAVVIAVPPLKDRLDDVPFLVQHFLSSLMDPQVPRSIEPAALDVLFSYDWPGNVRELRNVVEATLLLSDGPVIGADAVEAALWRGHARQVNPQPTDFERRRMLEVLEQVAWDTAAAARVMGVHRVTIYRRMHRLGLHGVRARASEPFAPVCADLQGFAANPDDIAPRANT